MKWKCPFCGTVFPPQASSQCPACGKTMMIAPLLKKNALQPDRPAASPRRPDTGTKDASLRQTLFRFAAQRNWPFTIGIIIVMILVSGILIREVSRSTTEDQTIKPADRVLYNLRILRTALELFHRDCGRYPTTEETMKVLVRNRGIAGWNGPYITMLRNDLWKNPYFYECTNASIRLLSRGPDGMLGTRDDIAAPLPDDALLHAIQPDVKISVGR